MPTIGPLRHKHLPCTRLCRNICPAISVSTADSIVTIVLISSCFFKLDKQRLNSFVKKLYINLVNIHIHIFYFYDKCYMLRMPIPCLWFSPSIFENIFIDHYIKIAVSARSGWGNVTWWIRILYSNFVEIELPLKLIFLHHGGKKFVESNMSNMYNPFHLSSFCSLSSFPRTT